MNQFWKDTLSGGMIPAALNDLGRKSDKLSELMSQNSEYKKKLDEMQAAQNPASTTGTPNTNIYRPAMKKGGKVKKMAKGGSASSRADGCAIKGKTKGRFV